MNGQLFLAGLVVVGIVMLQGRILSGLSTPNSTKTLSGPSGYGVSGTVGYDNRELPYGSQRIYRG